VHKRRQQHTPTGPVRIGDTSVSPVAAVRDLGVYLAADVSMAARHHHNCAPSGTPCAVFSVT